MFGTIRKHQTWLWAVIITMTIISFVYFFSPYQKMTSGEGSANFGSINGQKITRENFGEARAEVYLYHFITYRSWPDEKKNPGFDADRETYFRLLLVQKQQEFGIHVSDDVVAKVAREMLRPYQSSSGAAADVFRDLIRQAGLTMADFERFVRHQIGMQELVSAVAMSGRLVTPQEAKGLYIREHEEMATEAVFFPPSNYLASVTMMPEAVATFFTSQLAVYRIPERVQVNYVQFELTNYLAEATNQLAKMTNLDANVEQAYRENPTNLLQELKAVSLEDAKIKVRERQLKNFETQAARKKAAEFAYVLDEKYSTAPDGLNILAKEKGLVVHVTAPFDRFDGPKDIAVGPAFTTTAFSLSNAPFAGPLIGDEAVYIITPNRRIPSEIPPFEQVRARVETDYKQSLATVLAQRAGLEFAQTATNQIAAGKTFSEICAAAKLTLVEIPPISLSTQSLPGYEPSVLNQLQLAAFGTPPGKVTAYWPSDEQTAGMFAQANLPGFVMFVKARIPISEDKLQRELPTFVNQVRSGRQSEAFQAWLRKEAERGLRDMPLLKQQPQPRTARS
jgi:hypothetical protein